MTPVTIPAMPARVRAIMDRVCAHYGIGINDLLHHGRTQATCRARFVVAHLIRTGVNEAGASPSLPQIGLWMNRDHTSILNMLRRYDELRDEIDWREDFTSAAPAQIAPFTHPPANHRLQMRQDMAEACG